LHMKKGALHKVGFWGYGFILLPIFVYLFVPPQALDASIVDKKGINLLSSQQVKSKPATNQPMPEDTDQTKLYQEEFNEIKKTDEIVFTEKNFASYLSVLDLYPNEVKGKKIRIKGFVFRDEEALEPDQFVLSRFTVSCCAADANVVGVITQFAQTPILKKDQWLEVEGVLSTTKRYGFDAPLIQLQNYRVIEAPKDPYIYFY
jgi:putative membrane protein